ncbi:MAG: efflux RND transporter periplasmic adaptor subunit [Bacteroidota bacterium]
MNKLNIHLIILFICLLSCNNSQKEQVVEQSLRPVKYVNVGSNKLVGYHNYTGLAKAQNEANLSFRVGGTVNKVFVKVGDKVRRGQTLASLDATD